MARRRTVGGAKYGMVGGVGGLLCVVLEKPFFWREKGVRL